MHIGIDLGNKRCGLAVEIGGIVFPKKIVERTKLIDALKKLLGKYPETDTFVVGLPYDLHGKDLRQLERTEQFIEKLKIIFSTISVVGYDERFSSFDAAQTHTREKRDDVAAAVILESYLRSRS